MHKDVIEKRLNMRFEDDSLAVVYTVPAQIQAKSLVVMLHGGPGGSKDGPVNLYKDLAEVLAHIGIASIRFDFQGVGESSGRYRDSTLTRSVAEYEAVWSLARSFGFARVAVIGESYGATIVLSSTKADPDVVCLLWPALYFLDGTFAPFVTAEKMDTARRDGFTIEDGVEVGLPFLEEILATGDVEAGIKNLAVPTLLIHGTADREVPSQQSQRAYELLNEPKKLILADGGDHCMVRPEERTLVNAEICAWLAKYL